MGRTEGLCLRQGRHKLSLRLLRSNLHGAMRVAFLAEGVLTSFPHHPQLLVWAAQVPGAECHFLAALRKSFLQLPQFKLLGATAVAFSAEGLLTSCRHLPQLPAWAAVVLGAECHCQARLRKSFLQLQACTVREDTAQALQPRWLFPLCRLHRLRTHWAVLADIVGQILSAR